jgi:hypothetical protein
MGDLQEKYAQIQTDFVEHEKKILQLTAASEELSVKLAKTKVKTHQGK